MAAEPKAERPSAQIVDAFNSALCAHLPYIEVAKRDPKLAALAASAPARVLDDMFGDGSGWARVHVVIDDYEPQKLNRLLVDLKLLGAARYIPYAYPHSDDQQVFGQLTPSVSLGIAQLHLDVAVPGGVPCSDTPMDGPVSVKMLSKIAQERRRGC